MATMDRDGDGTPVRMAHDVVAAVDPCDSEADALQGLDYLCSGHCRDGARQGTVTYQRSGDVECQRQLVRYPDLFDEKFQAPAQVGNRGLLRRPVAERSYAGT